MFKKLIISSLFVLFCITILGLTVRGDKGSPLYFQNENDQRLGGPFELSNGASRYALTKTIVENKTFFLDEKLAKFSTPDVVDFQGKFISIFTPGVSFIAIPFYIVGKLFGAPQFVSYLAITFFAILNTILVASLAKKLGANYYASILSGLIFLFSTNALVYAHNFTQHHLSTTIILISLLNALRKRTFVNNCILGFLISGGVLVDIPNLLLVAPIGIYAFLKSLNIEKVGGQIKLLIKASIIGFLIGIIPLLSLFAWYNFQTTGSLTKIGQNIGRTHYFRENLPPRNSAEGIGSGEKESKGVKLPFKTRAQLQGFYVLLFSNERSWLFYSPILLLGFWGFWFSYKSKVNQNIVALCTSIIMVNIVVYSMFGDPWGGWAFGSRYLIPSAAILSSAIALLFKQYGRKIFFNILLVLLILYSAAISLLGALTTSAIPPAIEAVNLLNPIPHTYVYNWQLLNNNFISSLVYNLFFVGEITPKIYYLIVYLLTITLITIPYIALIKEHKNAT